MAAVQQRILNWLYSVLTSEYQDVNRSYNDVAQALSHYSTLSPKTEVYTYENGVSALLLQLSGTLPVAFRGMTYRFPITVWIPHQYPRVEPIVYVSPAEGMMVRAGQHVDPQGRVYHPYLAGWAEFQDKSNILDFLAILRDVFAKEPPVVSRQSRTTPITSPRPQSIPPPVPPLPPDITRAPVAPSSSNAPQPPPPPPKPYEASAQQSRPQQPGQSNTGPPLPPTPPFVSPGSTQSPIPPYQNTYSQTTPQRQSSSRYESAPPLPPQPQPQPVQNHRNPSFQPQQPPTQANAPYGAPQTQPHYPAGPANPHQPPPWQQPQQQQAPWPQQPHAPQQPQPQPQPKPKPPPPRDLLDDANPLTLTCTPTPIPAPPIPLNPEKSALLHTLAHTLHATRHAAAARTLDTTHSLAAQHAALLSALHALQSESAQLDALSATLASNSASLSAALGAADALIVRAPQMTPPSVDELLVAPTAVANQLYDAVAEERALGDTIFVLGRAVEKGRINPQTFVKVTRGLAREWWLKKVLVRKCAVGLGLDDGGGWARDDGRS